MGLPYVYDLLIAVGYVLMLPAIAVLYVRHIAVRDTGAILGLIAGATTVILGLAASVALDLRPAALLALGMWWWTIGKMWVETSVITPVLGLVTATLGVLAIAGAFAAAAIPELLQPGAAPAGQMWTTVQLVMGLWLFGLAATLWMPRDGARS